MSNESLGGITQETIDMQFREAVGMVNQLRTATSAKAGKDITIGSNVLYGYPLEAPSKKLYPIEDSMRRRIPRWVNPIGGKYAHWKVVLAINSAALKAGVAEGNLNTLLTIADYDKSAKYITLNMADKYSDEARFGGRRYEDIAAYTMLATLQSLMMEEDVYIIGGCDALINMPTSTLTVTDSATVGTLTPGANYDFGVSALTLHGYLNQQVATGVAGIGPGYISATNAADETDALANVTHGAIGAGVTSVDLAWTAVKGAFAYNVYALVHGGVGVTVLRFLKTVTTNATNVGTITPAGAGVPNLLDKTQDILGYQGLLQQIVALSAPTTITDPGTYGTMTAYYKSMNGGQLNGDGAAGVTEIDDALQSIWNHGRISPTLILANAQESRSLKALAIGSSSTNAARIMVAMDGQAEFKAGAAVTAYYNPFTAQWIPIINSLHMAPGTMLLIGERVPYPNSETPNNIEIELQQDYYAEEFARTDRSIKVGVSCIGVQKLYFPTACGIIQNITPTT